MEPQRAAPRLYLVTPPALQPGVLTRDLSAALAAADVAAVLLRLPEGGENELAKTVKAVAPAVQAKDAPLLIHGHPHLVGRGGADGAHLPGIDAFRAAAGSLQPQRIAGCGGLKTRHDAMLAAESGADYVMFGEPDAEGRRPTPDAVVERVAWWAEVFEIPCVGYAGSLDEAAALAQAGADFVALGDFIWADAAGVVAAVEAAARRIEIAEPVR